MRLDTETYLRSPALLRSICGVYSLGLFTLLTPLHNLRKAKNDYLYLQVRVLETIRLQKSERRALRAKIRYYKQEIKRMEEERKMEEEETKKEEKRR